MPLSAAFHFFSPFHSKKKYHYIALLSNSILSFFSFLHFTPSVNSLSAPIFVILLLLLKDNKILGDLRVNHHHP